MIGQFNARATKDDFVKQVVAAIQPVCGRQMRTEWLRPEQVKGRQLDAHANVGLA